MPDNELHVEDVKINLRKSIAYREEVLQAQVLEPDTSEFTF